jgi:hypothetical protein
VSNAYAVTLAALVLAGGALGDRLGAARALAGGTAAFVAASILCALAPTASLLIAARALQGAAAAVMVPGSLALIAVAYPPAERGRAIGRWAAASALTTALGPVLGGLLLSTELPGAWRGVFAVNLPLGLAALWLLRPALSARGRPDRGLDLLGAALATAGLGALAGGLTVLSLPVTLLGLALLLAFLLWESRAVHPMMPLGLFRDRGFAAANAATFSLYAALSAVLFFLPMLLVAGWGLSEARASLAFLPLSVLIFLLSSRFGALADRVGPAPLIAGGALAVALSYAWLALALPGGAFWTGVVAPLSLAGLGMAMVVAPLSAAVMAGASGDEGAASGINNAVSRVAGLVAVAALGPAAAAAYAAAGGPATFGEAAHGLHAEASARAMALLAWAAAALAAGAAALALWAAPRKGTA